MSIDDERDDAIDRAEDHAAGDWLEAAFDAGVRLASNRRTLVSEQVFDLIPDVSTHEPRAMGAVMRRLRNAGYIAPTDTFVKSPSPRGHGRPSRVWRSLICDGAHV